MTIAACYLSTEGVVLGADSTVTMGDRYYNFAQKVFEFGDPGSTIGVVIWGLGSFQDASYRTLIAQAAEEAWQQKLGALGEVAVLFSNMFWTQYTSSFGSSLAEVRSLNDKPSKSQAEEEKFLSLLHGLSGGFCIGGRTRANRTPGAYEFLFDPKMTAAPAPQTLASGLAKFWGQQSLIERQIYGCKGRCSRTFLTAASGQDRHGTYLISSSRMVSCCRPWTCR